MRRNGWLASLSLALALGTAAVSPAVAQQDGGGRGGQPGRGPGGFGGGMMMMGGGGGGGPTALLGMLRSESVQKELELSDEEKESLTKLGETAREKMRPQGAGGGPGGFPNFGEMSEEERTKMMEDMRKRGEEVGKMVQEELETILRPSKLSRLMGI